MSGINKEKFSLVIHGGAGIILKEEMTAEDENNHKKVLKESLAAGYEILKNRGSAIDAVETAIRIMEDSPLFNAGKGAVFTHEGKNEMDASVMNGRTLGAGAVAGVRTIRNPISAARAVMEKSQHVMMIGKGAEDFAKFQGLEIVDPSYFFTQYRYDQLKKIQNTNKTELDHSVTEMADKKFGTVGAVARDINGNLAAGTSTGGMTNKRYGRVGDSAIIGAGTFANNKTCAISTTGHGEYFIFFVASHDISALMEYKGYSLKKATNEVIMKKLLNMGGKGGAIGVDYEGNIAMPFNTPGMYRGYVKSDGKIKVFIY